MLLQLFSFRILSEKRFSYGLSSICFVNVMSLFPFLVLIVGRGI